MILDASMKIKQFIPLNATERVTNDMFFYNYKNEKLFQFGNSYGYYDLDEKLDRAEKMIWVGLYKHTIPITDKNYEEKVQFQEDIKTIFDSKYTN